MGKKRTKAGYQRELARAARWRKAHPWARFVEWARRRCACTDEKQWYPYYGAKNIEVTLKAAELEEIWHRDKAHLLKKPSLDRIESMYNYSNWNVRFIEFEHNSRLAWDKNFVPPPAEQVPEFT